MVDIKLIKFKLWDNRINIAVWCALCVGVLFVYHMFSDGDFSFLLTLGGIVRMFALIMLLTKIMIHPKHAEGISGKTMQLYVLTFIFRLSSILFYEGYLPFDKSGDWFYQTVEVVSLLMSVTAVMMIYVVYGNEYRSEKDAFGWTSYVPNVLGNLFLIVPCLILAVIFHPSLNSNFFTDTAWTFAMCIESVAIIPQLVVFQKTGGIVEFYTSHFVAALGIARLFSLVFWMSSFHELNDKYSSNPTGQYVGYFVVASQFIQLFLMADYLWYYLIALKNGSQVKVPTRGVDQMV